jgi:hypothetical protein
MRTKEMKHALVESKPGELGFGCKSGKRYPIVKDLEAHAADQNLIEKNEAKAAAERQVDAVLSSTDDRTPHAIFPAEPAETPEQASPETPAATVAAPAGPEPKPPHSQQAPAPVPQAPQALSPSNLPLDLENLSLNQINFIGQTMAQSGMFPDVTDGAEALVKILAGKEIGVTPFQAMTNIHIIQGKATMGANLMAAKVKGTGKYDYRVTKLSGEVCTIAFKQRAGLMGQVWEDLGEFTYSLEDAKRAGLVKTGSSWEKYPQNMLFARAISSGVRI